MRVKEAVVLAGGLGTRLREAVPDLPKCMAPVADKPFLSYVVDHLLMQGIEQFIFSLGFKHEIIEAYLSHHYPTLSYKVVIEEEPLGTGGAIHLALQSAETSHVLITNGDTLFEINVESLSSLHLESDAECTLALKPMHNFSRYGTVALDKQNRIVSFEEKRFHEQGLINGGSYLLNKGKFFLHSFLQKFSFEKDYLERFGSEGLFYGSVQEGYFIDIGIPQDFEQAQKDFKRPGLDLSQIDKNWTLFLDRDGVINDERVGDYVQHWDQFIFSTGVLQLFKSLTNKFGRIIVVSNQRGVGRGIMTEAALQSIHLEMQREVEIVGGKIDAIYYCTDVEAKSYNRKPNPGMAFQAKKTFPDIDYSRSVMVGNKPSDMRFGKTAGMFTIFITSTNPDQTFPHPDIDALYPSLQAFALALQS